MIKLAQVRLAINYVLRQRMTKEAASGTENPTIPYWVGNPYGDGRRFSVKETSPEGLSTEKFFRNQTDMDTYQQNRNPEILRHGNTRDLYTPGLRDYIGPLWNHGLDLWQHQRNKPYEDWRKRYSEYWNSPSAPDMFDPNYQEEEDKWFKENPAPPQAPPMPEDLYMKAPTGRYY